MFLLPQGGQSDRHRFAACQARVCDHHDPIGAQLLHVEADFAGDARPVLNAGGVDRECAFLHRSGPFGGAD